MDLFQIVAIMFVLTTTFGCLNHRYMGLPTTVGLMVIALGLSLLLIILVHPLDSRLEQDAARMLESIDFDRTLLHGLLGFLLFAGAPRAWQITRASSSKSRSAATWLPRARSIASRGFPPASRRCRPGRRARPWQEGGSCTDRFNPIWAAGVAALSTGVVAVLSAPRGAPGEQTLSWEEASNRPPVEGRMTIMGPAISQAVHILVLALAVLTAPLVGQAQTAAKVARIGVIGESSPPDPLVAALRQGLRELGHAEGESILIEERSLEGVVDRAPKLAAELLQLRVDVLVVGGTVVARAVRAQTRTVPIVFTLVSDPVASGLVTSLSRPGGNATGLSTVVADLSQKQLEFLQAAVPSITGVAVVFNPANPTARSAVSGVQEAARSRAMRVHLLEVRNRHELPAALSASAAKRVDALLAISDPAVTGTELAKLVTTHRLPAISAPTSFVRRGGLLAYGPSYSHNWFRAATYVDKILKGARPADIPVERPTKFELAVNLKTARALGLTIPQSVLLLADEIIQ